MDRSAEKGWGMGAARKRRPDPVDENEARFCTHLAGGDSWSLPFNRGWNDGAGNPPNPDGIKTDYLWREALARESVTDISV